jgi:hypothetical protein
MILQPRTVQGNGTQITHYYSKSLNGNDRRQASVPIGIGGGVFLVPELAVEAVGDAERILQQKVVLIGRRVLALVVDDGAIPLHEVLLDPLQEHKGHAPPCRLIRDNEEH